jgi:secreted trypsin-like serine protease
MIYTFDNVISETCSSLQNMVTTKVVCEYKGKVIENCTDPADGTIAKFKCAEFYEEKSFNLGSLLCVDGTWSRPHPKCVPVCGQKSNPSPASVNGSTASKGEFPWQVAILYHHFKVPKKMRLMCTGTLISERIILTAAHCVKAHSGRMLHKISYILAVGKYYRNFSDPRDAHQAQFSEVEDIFVPEQYVGGYGSLGDIAIMVSKKVFKFTLTVQPVCVDWTKTMDDFSNSEKKELGYINEWSYMSEAGTPSEELRSIRVNLASRQICLSHLSHLEKFLTSDKLCVGHPYEPFISIMYSGGGLVFKRADNRFYIVGVMCLFPQSRYAVYTDVKFYVDNFLLEKVARYNIL